MDRREFLKGVVISTATTVVAAGCGGGGWVEELGGLERSPASTRFPGRHEQMPTPWLEFLGPAVSDPRDGLTRVVRWANNGNETAYQATLELVEQVDGGFRTIRHEGPFTVHAGATVETRMTFSFKQLERFSQRWRFICYDVLMDPVEYQLGRKAIVA
jgi:hypothetical protein